MIPAPSYDQIEKILNQENFQTDSGFVIGLPSSVNTVAFILFDQNFGREPVTDFINNIEMLNTHSGQDFNFFLCGVSKYGPNDGVAKEIGTLNGVKMYHNPQAAASFIDAFEMNIENWKYDYGFELVLVDIALMNEQRQLDFSSAVFFKIEELIKIGVIDRPSQLCGKIIKFARDGKFVNANAFKQELQSVFGANWLQGLLLAMFPAAVGKLARGQAALGGGATLPE